MTRKIPIISLEDFEAKAKKLTVMKSLVNNIAEGVKDNLESVNVAEIKNYNIIISVPKSEWKSGLEKYSEEYFRLLSFPPLSFLVGSFYPLGEGS